METTKELFKISVSLRGVKKNCRKTDFHVLKGGYIDYNAGDFNQDAIDAIASGLVNSNIKRIHSDITVHLDYVQQGEIMQTWQPFSDKNVRFELKTSLENALQ